MPKLTKAKAVPAEDKASSPPDDQFRTVERFWQRLTALLPNSVPDADQTSLIAIAVRMSAHDRDLLLSILERGIVKKK